ncbi:MAG: MgtC/SapB family protein [Thermoplasmata archaeon]|nr:MAG: MgtC/SapB family protein [Thermoplasmata archaeon]
MLAEISRDFSVGSWELTAMLRLIVAAVLGGLIGLEREQHGRSAGLRTHLLVALGAATAMVVSLHFSVIYGLKGAATSIRVDPARVAYGVMGGIGFLGAGTIIQSGLGVRGLTTAACLWCTAAIGLAAGFGMFAVSFLSTIIVLFALVVLDYIDRKLPARITKRVVIRIPETSIEQIHRYEQILQQKGVKVIPAGYSCDYRKNCSTITLRVSARSERMREVLDEFHKSAPEVIDIEVV